MRARVRRQVATWAPAASGVNPAGVEQTRELVEVMALLLECALAGGTSTPTIERAFENTGAAIGEVRVRVQVLAQLLRVKPRLVKSE